MLSPHSFLVSESDLLELINEIADSLLGLRVFMICALMLLLVEVLELNQSVDNLSGAIRNLLTVVTADTNPIKKGSKTCCEDHHK